MTGHGGRLVGARRRYWRWGNHWLGCRVSEAGFGLWLFPLKVFIRLQGFQVITLTIGPLHLDVTFWWHSFWLEWKLRP